MTNRRGLLFQGLSGMIMPGLLAGAGVAQAESTKTMRMPSFKGSPYRALEDKAGGRIGVFAVQGANRVAYRHNETFAMCSTFKWLLVAAVLQANDRGALNLDQPVKYGPDDLLEYAPVTRARVAEGAMSIEALCEAAITQSDNTAANLLLPLIGGPAGLTTFVRGLGDKVTRLDRREPELNSNINNDPRDTTSPKAMTQLLLSVYNRGVLDPDSLAALRGWMVASTTGLTCIRAGVPSDWVVGDKTGSGEFGARNDVAVLWPPSDSPVYMAIYCTGSKRDLTARNQLIADITRAVLDELA